MMNDDDGDVMMDVENVNENDLMMNSYYLLNVMVEALNDDENYDDHHRY